MPSYKNENTGKWYCSFYYTDSSGKRKKKKKEGFKTKREAEQWEREFLTSSTASTEITINALYSLYIEDKKKRIRPSSLSSLNIDFQAHILPHFGNMPVNKITPIDIKNWQNELLAKKKRVDANATLSPKYINQQKNHLSALFNYAVKLYGLEKNPCKLVDALKITSKPKIDIWTEEQFTHFLDGINRRDNVLPYLILFYGGLRIGELLALTWGDIDFENKTICIDKSIQRIGEWGNSTMVGAPKTNSGYRTIKMPDKVFEELEYYKTRYYNPKEEYAIFLKDMGWYRYILDSTAKKQGLEPIRLHDLRHSHVSHLIHLGVNPVAISKRVGHENVSITLDTYSHLYPDAENEIMELFNGK